MSIANPRARAQELLAQHVPALLRSPIADVVVPETGKNSEVYLLFMDDGTRAVLRVLRPAAESAALADVLAYATANGAPVPRVLGCSGMMRRLLHRDEGVVVEQFIEGRLWRDAGFAIETNAAVVRAAAALHNVVRDRYGPLGHPHRGAIHDAVLRGVLATLDEIKPEAAGCTAAEIDGWKARARDLHAAMPRVEACSLVHKHLGKSDVMVGPDGRATLLDCVSLQFGHFGQDVADVLEIVRRNGAGDQAAELGAEYMAARTGLPAGAAWGEFAPFFLLDHHAKRLRSMARKSSADRADRDAELAASLAALRTM